MDQYVIFTAMFHAFGYLKRNVREERIPIDL